MIEQVGLFENEVLETYVDNHLLSKKSEEQLENNLNLARKGLIKIKHSCILKFALAFGIEKFKDEVK